MKLYNEWCETLYWSVHKRRKVFLIMNTLFFGLLGLVLWYVIHFIAFNRLDWLICFVGYPAVCFGYMGGLLYFMRMD